jgi:hypothetical protein
MLVGMRINEFVTKCIYYSAVYFYERNNCMDGYAFHKRFVITTICVIKNTFHASCEITT